ncbi:MAG: hypothetical protein DI551_02645 [Micavibrio aeruginosavorus]|uniref:Uncharacterized protein n=1 Tax=Micavibrio aeruginosavorus TaxID=349221 RepID=A0A2W5Q913_9BACT|nr:MAG: hypothetical protein DI551_02645 [Micavibrio aeruginosavorus]
MSISPETYIVISLMFAVFAAVAAVGTSVVLGAGFERLRAGFEVVRKQSGFFADAIYKLDMRTQKSDEEISKLKSGVYSLGERIDRAEKTATFLVDGMNSLEQRILSGSPSQNIQPRQAAPRQVVMTGFVGRPPMREQRVAQPEPQPQRLEAVPSSLYRDLDVGPQTDDHEMMSPDMIHEPQDQGIGLTTLLSRYFTGETSGSARGVVYH